MKSCVYKGTLLLGLVVLGLGSPDLAQASSARELGQTELRALSRTGKTINLKTALRTVSDSLHASVLEVRAFDAGGLYYRVVLKGHHGRLHAVVIDAQTGLLLSEGSALRADILAAAR